MSVREILRMGNPVLHQVSAPVEDIRANSERLHALVADMTATMASVSGAGLAAPQIGVLERVIIFGSGAVNPRYPDREIVPRTVIVNPSFEVIDPTEVSMFEGCLSVPGLRGCVWRPRAIRYRGFDLDGNEIGPREVDGFHARVFQHEYDHLDGRLYPSRIRTEDMAQFGFIEELQRANLIPL